MGWRDSVSKIIQESKSYEDLAREYAKQFDEQPFETTRKAIGGAGRATLMGLGGIADLLATPVDLLQQGMQKVANPDKPAVSFADAGLSYREGMGAFADRLANLAAGEGASAEDFKPSNKLSRVAETATEFAVSAPAFGASRTKDILSAINSGATFEVLREKYPDSALVPILGSILAGGGTSAALNRLEAMGNAGAFTPTRALGGYSTSQNISKGEMAVYRQLIDSGMSHDEAVSAISKFGEGNIPLSGAEQLDVANLEKFQRAIMKGGGKGEEIFKDFFAKREGAYQGGIKKALGEGIGEVQSVDVAGRRIVEQSKNVINSLTKKRSGKADALYESVRQQVTPSEVHQSLMNNPVLSSTYAATVKDPVWQAQLAKYQEGSIGWWDVVKQSIDDDISAAKRASQGKRAKALQGAKDELLASLDSVSDYGKARAAYAKYSPPVNKAEDSLLGVLRDIDEKGGDVSSASKKIFGGSEAQVKYARGMLQKQAPDVWDSMVASHISRIADKQGYSPKRFYNALTTGDMGLNLRVALSPKQLSNLDEITDVLKKASKIQQGSTTAENLKSEELLFGEASGASERAVAMAQKMRGKGVIEAATDATKWMHNKVMQKRYAEIADILTGNTAKDLAEKLRSRPDLAGKIHAFRDFITDIERGVKTPISRGVESVLSPKKEMDESPLPSAAGPESAGASGGWRAAVERLKNQKDVTPTDIGPQSSNLPQDIQRDEGLRLAAYTDTTGNTTVGHGFNMDSGIARKVWEKAGIGSDFDAVYAGEQGITPKEAERLGGVSHQIALEDAASLYGDLPKLSRGKQAALVNLSYNLGKTKLSKFKSFNAAVNRGDWKEAVRQLNNTPWRVQVGKDRATSIYRNLLS